MSTSWNLDITYPAPFSVLLGMLSVFSLDFLAVECFQEDVVNRYFTTVMLWSSIPIVLMFAIVFVGIVRLFIHHSFTTASGGDFYEDTHRHRIINEHVWCALLLSYLVLPPGSLRDANLSQNTRG
jgi:hypothetical protein